jgi:RNA polymerase sigma-54 factor
MRKSLELLRLSAVELQMATAQELRENPFLIRDFRDGMQRGSTLVEFSPDTMAAAPPMLERLHRQIGLMQIAPEARAVAEYLAAELREDGYLETPVPEVAAQLGLSVARVEAGLAALQACDPPGIGARTLAECLALQLMDAAQLPRVLADVIVARLEDFVAGRGAAVAAAVGLDAATQARVESALPCLASQPVADAGRPAPAFWPDLIVRANPDGALAVDLCRDTAPRIRLDPRLVALAGNDDATLEYRARAEALLAALRYRGETLLRLGQAIIAAQAPFFAGARDDIRPLSRREVAGALGLHPSTVGRAVASKAIEAGGRVYPLSMFFSAALPGADGRAVSAHAVRHRIAALIGAEPACAPLSDARICAALNAEGVDIARRTVTKYRQWMRLPATTGRRRTALNRRRRAERADIPQE